MVLSLHYQTGLRASPDRVALEPEQNSGGLTPPDAGDLVPFLRLRVERPVARVTIRWQER